MLSGEPTSERQTDRNKSEDDDAESISSSDDSQSQPWENVSETTSIIDVSEIAIHSLLVDWKQRGLKREMHQDPNRDRYTSEEEGRVVDNAADELELIAVSKRPIRLLPHATVVRTNLEPSMQVKKLWCVKLMDDAHAPEIVSGQPNVLKTYLKAKYRLSGLLGVQRNDRMTSYLKKWIENKAPDKEDLEEDSYKILKQTYVRGVTRRQQELNDLCRRNTQEAQIRQKRRSDKMTADAKAYSVICLCVPGASSTKENQKIWKIWKKTAIRS